MLNRFFQASVIILFCASLLQVIIGVGQVLNETQLIDFSVYYHAAKNVLSGLNPYLQTYGDNIVFNYPPSSLFLFALFALFDIKAAQTIFTLLSFLSLLASGYLLTNIFPETSNWVTKLLILSALMQNFPTKFTLVMGQVNLFVLFFIVLSYIYDQKRKSVASGIFWGAAIMLKLTPIFLALYFIIRRKYTILFMGIFLTIISNVIPLLFFNQTPYFFSTRLPELAFQTLTTTSIYDQSLRAFIARAWNSQVAVGISLIIVAALTLSSIWQYRRSNLKGKYDKIYADLRLFSILFALVTIGNSYAWQHHFIFLFPGFIVETIYLLSRYPERSEGYSRDSSTFGLRTTQWRLKSILLLLSSILVAYHFPDISHPPTTNPILISHSLIGALVLIGLLLTQSSYNIHFYRTLK